jgi:hypothetical protein
VLLGLIFLPLIALPIAFFARWLRHMLRSSVAVAAVEEASGDLLERASFPQDRADLSALERWAKRVPERRWAMENARGLGRHLAVRLAG